MKKAYVDLIDYALERNWSMSVWDGEEWAVTRGKERKPVLEAIHSVEGSAVRFFDESDVYLGEAEIIWGWDMQPDETIVNWRWPAKAHDHIKDWQDDYFRREVDKP